MQMDNPVEQTERLWTSDMTARLWTHSNRRRDENDLSFIYCQVSVVAVAALLRALNNRCGHVQRGVLGWRVLDPHQRQTLESQYQTPQRLTFPGFPFSKTSIFPFRAHAPACTHAHKHTHAPPTRSIFSRSLRQQSTKPITATRRGCHAHPSDKMSPEKLCQETLGRLGAS